VSSNDTSSSTATGPASDLVVVRPDYRFARLAPMVLMIALDDDAHAPGLQRDERKATIGVSLRHGARTISVVRLQRWATGVMRGRRG